MSVTDRHLEFYKERGYVVLEGVLSDDDLEPVIQDHIAIVDEKARALHAEGKIAQLCEGEPFETRLARLAAQLAGVEETPEIGFCPDIGATRRRDTFEFMRNKNLVDAIEPFIGPEITWNPVSHIRPKMPGTDVMFHQDAVFTTQEAKDILQVTVWLPLVPATEENGCLQVMPGVHEERMVYWTYAADLPDVEPVSLPMAKGDVLIMHKLTPHGSGPNKTDAVRWSMDLRYQKTGEPSPRPEWPSQIVRSRSDPAGETAYEDWRDAWAQRLAETPTQLRYPRPSEPLPFGGEMYYA
ncbi:MAG: mitomycin antibiotic biosynthesis protein [Gemmatimonadetes bacterium]|jgi:phytanoyl-CoA hydroxylase|nr:mitomycin antibiotic biosynthesis protein [Gemmatimonadota bacterium]|tara:strand:- start:144 stop:1031 length:888 start_codon:yes stop_codon:yes gene_type:complete